MDQILRRLSFLKLPVDKKEFDPVVTEVVSVEENDPCLIKFSTADRDKRRKEKKK